MRGAAWRFADLARDAPAGLEPDVTLASDFLNLADWHAMAPRSFRDAPSILYFHENQATYPLGAKAPRDHHYGWINLASALAADRVLFNSSFHRREFLSEVRRVLARMPDHLPRDVAGRIELKSGVFPVGIDFTPHREALLRAPRRENPVPVLAWNHRWEEEKGPEEMVEALFRLKERRIPFRAVLCGQSSRVAPAAMLRARRLGPELQHLGFFQDRSEYLEALAGADLVLSTARQEFFGVSIVEALFMGCLPVLPRALSYVEIIPLALHDAFLYDGPSHLDNLLAKVLARLPVEHRRELEEAAARYDWKDLAGKLDDIVEETHAKGRA